MGSDLESTEDLTEAILPGYSDLTESSRAKYAGWTRNRTDITLDARKKLIRGLLSRQQRRELNAKK